MPTLAGLLIVVGVLGMAGGVAAEPDEPDSGLDDPDIYDAGEVVIVERRIPAIERAGTTTVVTADEIAAHGDKTLDQVLARLPGITVYTHTKGHTRVRLRGFDQANLVVLIDGVPIDDIYSTDIDLSSIPLINVSRIIVERGVSSALYGTDGTVGVIHVITAKPTRPMAEVATEYGLYNNSSVSASVGAPFGGFTGLLGGSIQHSDGYAPSARLDRETRRAWFDRLIRYDLFPVDGPFGNGPANTFDDVLTPAKEQYLDDTGLWDHQRFTRYQLSAKVGYALAERLEIGSTASFFLYRGETNTYEVAAYSSYRGDAWKPNWPYFGDDPLEVKKFALRNRAFVYPEVYELRISPFVRFSGEALTLILTPFYLEHQAEQEGYASTDHVHFKGESLLLQGQGIIEPFLDTKKYRSSGVRFMPSYRFAPWHRLSGAVMFRNDNYLGAERALDAARSPQTFALMGGGPYRVEDLAAWALSVGLEDELTLFDTLQLSAGISYDAFDFYRFRSRAGQEYAERYIVDDDAWLVGSRDSLNPVAGAVWEAVRDRLRLQASGAIKTRFPSLGDYAKIETETQDELLRPERAYSANGGFELMFFDRAVSFRSDYFVSLINDKIVKLAKEEPPVNADRQTARGVETIVTLGLDGIGPLAGLDASFGHTYVQARNEDFSDDATVNKGRLVEFTPTHQVTADLGLDFRTGTSVELWLTALVDQVIYTMDHRPTSLDAPYSTGYFRAVRLHDPVFLNARLAQSFFDDYEAAFTVRNILDDYDMDPFNPGPGRMFYLSLAANWGN